MWILTRREALVEVRPHALPMHTQARPNVRPRHSMPSPLQADPKLVTAVGVPNHPSYPANHSCISGAMGRVLDAHVPGSNGVFEAMGKEAGASRVYGGIHYQMDDDAGDEIARKIAARAIQSGPAKGQPYTPAGR